MLLGESPEDYDRHFILTADIDLDPNLPGRKVFDKAVIGNFTGVFDGNGHTISHLTITGGSYLGLFRTLRSGAKISNLGLEGVDVNGTGVHVGGLAGYNRGSIATSFGTGTVSGGSDVGRRSHVGGLAGYNGGIIAASYSACTVSGTGTHVGGLVGSNSGSIATSCSTGMVSGDHDVGGLVGGRGGSITASFWDMETSGQTTSAGGTGLTTAEMQDINTFLNAGWDFVDEIVNGTCDYWQISPADYPRLHHHAGDSPVMPEGLGTTQEPYLIRDARDLGTVWSRPLAHYRLEASVGLSGITWSMAVVPWFEGTFEGNGYVISNLHIQGGGYLGLFGELASGAKISNLGLEAVDVNGTGGYVGGLVGRIGSWESRGGVLTNCYSTGTVTGTRAVGGLVGDNFGSITTSYSTCTVRGEWSVGGLMGGNGLTDLPMGGVLTNCYSTGMVDGEEFVGGLVGENNGSITAGYSAGAVNGSHNVGGLVGYNYYGNSTTSFWDMETSGQTTSAGGTGKTTAEMQTASTFLDADWDFVDETANGTDDIWRILEGQDYPRLWWQYGRAFSPYPQDGAIDVGQPLLVSWLPGGSGLLHDVYLGEDQEAVTGATTESPGIYRGRQSAEPTAYDPGILELATTYYWRVDEVNEADPNSPWRGDVWSFTTADFIVVDDFESYNDLPEDMPGSNLIFLTWIDGWDNPTENGAIVGCLISTWNCSNVHGGSQAMPYSYYNNFKTSQATRALTSLRDWTQGGVARLSLWFYGDPANAPELMNVALNGTAPVYHDDPSAATIGTWTEWIIDLSRFGVPLTDVNSMTIGFGVPGSTAAGGAGFMIFDDIRLYLPAPEPAP
jgi:hypothetical protein